ncbi:alpha-N-acetylglucosaminidase isoform X2 [Brachionus plicatilis]|uniref:Alpha-N-acetylglucosaminidase isoform X2 n=1 Tax=Brachionus plicatilis TaxID=10195 RepID=A0A3M7R2H9_BRAPC|nr:alpha-N-acetylglucosaminidase isoform X2 [Brachionus plicatilis]
MIEILDDMEELLASDDHYLLSSWLKKAKSKGSNRDERILYEFNARSQLTLWGLNSTSEVFDYACKAWSGLIADYYKPRWTIFFKEAELSMIRGEPIDNRDLVENLLLNAEFPFIFSKKNYPEAPIGNSITIIKQIHSKYRL